MSSLEGKVALVTGTTGFIGAHLVERLKRVAGLRVVTLSRSTGDVVASLDTLTAETWRKAGVDRLDVIFHLGAFTPKSGDTANQIEEIYRDNLEGTRRLLDSLHSLPSKPERIVFASTLDVYAPPAPAAVLSESSPIAPVSLYGSSKLFCEHLVRVWGEKNGAKTIVLRYGHIFGPGEAAYKKLIPLTINTLLNNESPAIYGAGFAERDFLYVEDVAEATLRAAMLDTTESPVNIVRGSSVTIGALVEMLVRLTGYSGEVRRVPMNRPETSLRFDNQRMVQVLGGWDFMSLEEGLRREIEAVRKARS
jgi:nucleoside-diphosphate-sugar epimerase